MKLSREAIQRMVGGVGMGTSTGGGGGEGFDGGATKSWVNTNFVSIEFFGRLFKAYGPGENQGDPDVEVLPNDMDSTISNIEAMFGFWTDFYLTALGNGGEIGASIYLSGLADVNVAGVQSGQVLTWNSAQNKWVATTPSSGVDMSVVWNALAAETSQQINASHLATALTGYATQTWVGQQGFATETWVNNNFVTPTTLATEMAKKVDVSFFDEIFQVFNNNTKIAVNGALPSDKSGMNIKAMFGFWTNFYVTALGNGGQIGASIYLSGLADVNVAGVANGQVLTWNAATNKWIATTPSSGVDMNQVWNALAAQTSQQINASHLSTALADYATQTWVGQQGYITSEELSGYATQTWVGQQGFATTAWVSSNFVTPTALATEMAKKVDVSFFDEIFQVFNDNTKIAVNGALPSDKSKMNIKAMFGFWTNFYVTALGNGGEIGASIYLSGLADVNVAGVQTGQVLTWNAESNKWIATTPQSGVDMNQVWNALAAQTSQQINASHLATALTGYATQTWVGQQGYITSTDITGYATQTWVGQNYLPLTGGTLTGALGVSGRLTGSGDDEGIVITPASNGLAGLILGGTTGRRSVFYLDNSSAFWRYCSGDGSSYYDITHPNASGTIALQSWVSGAYLPLTGGTLTGALQVNATIFGYNYTNSNNAAAFIFDKPGNNYTGIGANAVNDQIYFGACDQNGAWISNYAQKWYFNGSIQSSGSLQAESVKIEQTNEINSYSGMLHLNYRVNTNMSLCNGGGSVGIGTVNPSYKLHVDGVIYSTTHVYSAGYVTALSDEREKNIIEEFEIPLDFIAKAPIVSYEWKDKERRGDKQHIGSIAQYWLREMPELVPEVNGRYTMDYGRIALLSAILTARHVVNLEQRIAELEKTLRGE